MVSSFSSPLSLKDSESIMDQIFKVALFWIIPALLALYPIVGRYFTNYQYFQLVAQTCFALGWCILLKYADVVFPMEKESPEQMLKISNNLSSSPELKRKDSLSNTN